MSTAAAKKEKRDRQLFFDREEKFAILSTMIRKTAGIFIGVFFLLNSLSFAHPFRPGEKLSYTIKLIGIPAGSQVLQVKEIVEDGTGPLYLLTSKVKSSGVVSFFFHLEDEIESYVDAKTLFPRFVRIKIQEDSRRENVEVEIKKEDKIKAFIWDKKRERKWEKKLSSPPLDMLSLIYWIRAQDLKIGKKYEVLLLDIPGSFKKIQFEISGLDKAYTYLGVFSALVCEQKGVENGIKVWFSQDKRHLPLYIQIATPFGYLKAILREIG